MAEIIKFNERNISLFGNVESTAGVYNAPSANQAIAATAMTGSVTYETGAFKFLGDNLSRLEYTYLKDVIADVTVDSFQQVIGNLSTTNTGPQILAAFPLTQFYQACGGHCTPITGSAWNGHPVGSLLIDNVNTPVTGGDVTLSVDFRKRSNQDTINDKLWKFLYMKGMVDLNASLGEVPTLKFALKGNSTPNPIAAAALTANYGLQATQVAASVRKQNVVSTTIAPAIPVVSITFAAAVATVYSPGHGLVSTDTIEISAVKINGVTTDDSLYNGAFSITAIVDTDHFTYTMSGTPTANALGTPIITVTTPGKLKTFNFSTLAATNAFGFDLIRYLTSTEEGFTKDATPVDVTIGMLENQSPFQNAVSITKSSTTATVTLPVAHGLAVGDVVTISGATDPLFNVTNAVVLSGGLTATAFTYTMTSTPVANAVADTNGSLSVIATKAANYTTAIGTTVNGAPLTTNSLAVLSGQFDADSNILGFFTVNIKFGTGAGKYITYKWNKLQLASVKDGKVSNLLSREMTFRNTGNSFVFFE